ncbi:MAG TPA: DUF2267 domain-containing protein [Nocardioidaceae bacterium]|nr:DUF2267 domain-containing protein [Nocardioidaceae bacterium]
MPITDVTLIEESAQKTHVLLKELAGELGREGDERYAMRVLRGYLHTLRDRLPVPETAQFGAQLPELVRGIYYEGWRPATVPRDYHDVDTFLALVAEEARLAGETEAAYAVEAATRVFLRHVGSGELAKVATALPPRIAQMINGTTPGAET